MDCLNKSIDSKPPSQTNHLQISTPYLSATSNKRPFFIQLLTFGNTFAGRLTITGFSLANSKIMSALSPLFTASLNSASTA